MKYGKYEIVCIDDECPVLIVGHEHGGFYQGIRLKPGMDEIEFVSEDVYGMLQTIDVYKTEKSGFGVEFCPTEYKKEITMQDICKKFGCKVKIIGENE